MVLCWWKRVWSCPHSRCEIRTWTEQHSAIAPRAALTERARAWAFEQVSAADAAVSRTAATLGVAWWTVMRQVIDRGTPEIDNPDRLAPSQSPVTAVGVDETAYLRANATRSTTFATGVADLTPSGRRDCSTWSRADQAACWTTGWASATPTGGRRSLRRRWTRSAATRPR